VAWFDAPPYGCGGTISESGHIQGCGEEDWAGVGRQVVAEDGNELTLVMDLLLLGSNNGRSRAIDRYAREVRLASASDEAMTLAAMRACRFHFLEVQDRHPQAVEQRLSGRPVRFDHPCVPETVYAVAVQAGITDRIRYERTGCPSPAGGPSMPGCRRGCFAD
jgi:hypothetical protein